VKRETWGPQVWRSMHACLQRTQHCVKVLTRPYVSHVSQDHPAGAGSLLPDPLPCNRSMFVSTHHEEGREEVEVGARERKPSIPCACVCAHA